MSTNLLVFGLEGSQKLMNRFCADLTPAEYLHRPCVKANCAAWLLGHLALTDRRLLTLLGTEGPVLPDGFEKRFSRDPGAPEADDFGDPSILLPIFNDHRTRLIAAVKAATPEMLAWPLEKAHPMFNTIGEMAAFFSIHTALHAGQITIVRRSLGRPPVV